MTVPTPDPPDCATNTFKCDWQEEYYGWRCSKCGDFIPFGCEPWMPIDDCEEEDDEDYGYE